MIEVQEVTDLDLVFPGSIGHLMPKMHEIPKDFFGMHNEWNRIASHWFFKGIHGVEFKPKLGVDTGKALRHLSVILRSFEPPHEHKEAAVAYLMSEWFESVTLPKEGR